MNKYKTVKSFRILVVSLISIFSLHILIGCDSPVASDSHAAGLPAGKGSFSLAFTDESRTILPAAPNLNDFAVYNLTFTPIDNGTFVRVDRTNTTLAKPPIILDPGTYSLVVNAYKDQGKTQLMSRGALDSITITAGSNTSGTVILKPLPSGGTGIFKWDISFPDVFIANMTVIPRQAGGTAQETVALSLPKAAGSRTLNSGQYNITINLEKMDGEELAWNELLYVYQNLESVFSYTFTDAHFVNPKYTVTFDGNGGNPSVGLQSVMHGGKVNSPEPPIRDGYSFGGWYIDSSASGNSWDFDSAIIESFTLYARWENRGTLRYQPVPYPGNSVTRAAGDIYDKIVYSAHDNEYNYYVFRLGHILHVPVAYRMATEFSGTTPITISYALSDTTEESITNSTTKAVENSVSRSTQSNWSVGVEVGYDDKIVAKVNTSVGGSSGIETTETVSTANTFETTVTKVSASTDSITATVGEHGEPVGKYRYSLFGTSDAFYVLVTNRANTKVIKANFTLCARPAAYRWVIDYEPDPSGVFGKTGNGDLLQEPNITLANLPEPRDVEDISALINVAAPVATPPAGKYTLDKRPMTISLSSSTDNAAIYYTTNGSAPTQSSTKYTGPITLPNDTVVKAIAVNRFFESEIMTATYTFAEEVYYVKDIYIHNHNKNEGLAWSGLLAQAPGIIGIRADLNKGAGGDWIYLGYTETTNPDEAIRGLYVVTNSSSKKDSTITANGVTYTLTKDLDLNRNAGGDFVWLYHSRQAAAGDPIKKLAIEIPSVLDPPTGAGWYRVGVDLNRKAGGKFVYLWYNK